MLIRSRRERHPLTNASVTRPFSVVAFVTGMVGVQSCGDPCALQAKSQALCFRMPRSLFALVLVLCSCGDDDRARTDSGPLPDVTLDVNQPDARDAGDDPDVPTTSDAGPQDCTSILETDVDFLLSEEGLAIHPAAVFDGDSLWLTYTAREGETPNFDVALRRVRCDGSLGPVVLVNEGTGESDLDSDIAISGERLLVGYQSDDESGEPSAIRPFVRAFDLTGTALGLPQAVAREREGVAIAATNWMVRVASRPDGFWVAGTWGVEEVSGFRGYAARLDLYGVELAPAADVAPTDQTESQTNLAISDGETPYIAWTNFGDDSQLESMPFGGTPTAFESGTITEDFPALSGELLTLQAGGGSRIGIQVHNLVTGAETSVGGVASLDASSDIAGTPDAFAIVWLRQIMGTRNQVFVASGSESGGEMTLSTPIEIETSANASPYPPFIVAMGEGRYFVGWTQVVMSPNFEVHGRIVEF